MASRASLLLVVLLVAVCVVAVRADLYTFSALLNGNQVVPPVTTTAQGAATFTYDDSSRMLYYEIDLQDIKDITAVHIHGPGLPGSSGPVIETLKNPSGEAQLAKGSLKLEKAHFDFLVSGRLYVQVHTTANPNGELRGQIITTINEFMANLRASHIIPSGSVSSGARGFGSFVYDPNTRTLSYNIEHDVDRPTAAHVHGPADRATNAGVAFQLDTPHSPIKGTRVLSDQQVAYLKTGLLYVAIHSERFTNGEVRGQILIDPSSSGYDGFGTTLVTGLVLSSIAIGALALLGGFAYWQQRKAGYSLVQTDA